MRLHRKHGLNPTMTTCYYCNEPSEIILVGADVKQFKDAGLASEDGEMQRNIGVLNGRPCPKCESLMEQGVIMISIRDGQDADIDRANEQHKLPNPYRTGGWVVVRDEFITRLIKDVELRDSILKNRVVFIPDATWDMLKIPRGEVKKDANTKG